MKIKALRNSNNEVIATFPAERPERKSTITFEPLAAEGQLIEELDVPKDFASNLSAFYQHANAQSAS